MHVHGARLDVRRGLPHRLEEVRAAERAAAALGERAQQAELRGGELDLLVVDPHAVRGTVDADRTGDEHVAGVRRSFHAAQDGSHAEDELLGAERLGQIVVRAEREPAYAVDLFLARREHHDRDAARGVVALQFLEHVEPGHARKHEVEHDEGGMFAARERERIRTGGGRGDAVPRLREVIDDERDDVRLVVDDEHALARHGRCGRRRRRAHLASPVIRRAIAPTRRSMATVLCPPRGTMTSA